MSKRMQLALSDEARVVVENVTREVNDGFDVGFISSSDVVSEMVLNAKIDFKALQAKHTDVRRSLRKLALNSDLDLDAAIKGLLDLKTRTQGKKLQKGQASQTEAT